MTNVNEEWQNFKSGLGWEHYDEQEFTYERRDNGSCSLKQRGPNGFRSQGSCSQEILKEAMRLHEISNVPTDTISVLKTGKKSRYIARQKNFMRSQVSRCNIFNLLFGT